MCCKWRECPRKKPWISILHKLPDFLTNIYRFLASRRSATLLSEFLRISPPRALKFRLQCPVFSGLAP